MLQIVDRFSRLDFSGLLAVYAGSTDTPAQEQAFYRYLREGFFTQQGDRYCLWVEEGSYRSALRLQAYRGGLLLEALETAPQYRRQGYARALIRATLAAFPDRSVYAHIYRRNWASAALHQSCGFRKISDVAVLADGSVTGQADTYCLRRDT